MAETAEIIQRINYFVSQKGIWLESDKDWQTKGRMDTIHNRKVGSSSLLSATNKIKHLAHSVQHKKSPARLATLTTNNT